MARRDTYINISICASKKRRLGLLGHRARSVVVLRGGELTQAKRLVQVPWNTVALEEVAREFFFWYRCDLARPRARTSELLLRRTAARPFQRNRVQTERVVHLLRVDGNAAMERPHDERADLRGDPSGKYDSDCAEERGRQETQAIRGRVRAPLGDVDQGVLR